MESTIYHMAGKFSRSKLKVIQDLLLCLTFSKIFRGQEEFPQEFLFLPSFNLTFQQSSCFFVTLPSKNYYTFIFVSYEFIFIDLFNYNKSKFRRKIIRFVS